MKIFWPILAFLQISAGLLLDLELHYSSLSDFQVSLSEVWVKAKCYATADFKHYMILLSIMQSLLKRLPPELLGNLASHKSGMKGCFGNVDAFLIQATCPLEYQPLIIHRDTLSS